MTTGISIGYVIWLVRSGVIMSSVLSTLPAWRLIDPLPILSSFDSGEDEEDDESIEELVQTSAQRHRIMNGADEGVATETDAKTDVETAETETHADLEEPESAGHLDGQEAAEADNGEHRDGEEDA